ncbi:hypothetical protein TRFO_07423 [Tritrichomonas foetus]|uniref:Myb-like DNA-binding domain containing protein n=1 Tax=Tritrichomonas foetus TaxID=1144522 RepID=A0A1J4JRT4_9EUKA|nr:hypothetical protein TRFO_07423 [Tritrichomonas foetus]|eukprot:OHT01847.1 hypothetical protein TRFO_07423 [Tritrichomonas foetus]
MLTEAQRKARLAGPSSKKVKFTKAEDTKLALLVQEFSDNDWKAIAEHMAPRTARQCRERWTNYVNPTLSKDPWTQEEDLLLVEKHKEFGNHWKIIERYFPKRSKNNIKHRWSALKDAVPSSNPSTTPNQTVSFPQPVAPQTSSSNSTPSASSLTSALTAVAAAAVSNNTSNLTINLLPSKPISIKNEPIAPVILPATSPMTQQSPVIIPITSVAPPILQLHPFSIEDTDTIRESTADPFQFFDRILDQHDSYIQSLDKSDLWSISEENFF